MKRKRTRNNVEELSQKFKDSYQQVFNEKGERVRGLWVRGGRFYAQLGATDGKPYRYHLEQAQTLPQAVLARQALKLKQQAGQLLPPAEMERQRLERERLEKEQLDKPRLEQERKVRGAEGKVGPADEKVGPDAPDDRLLKSVVAKYQKDRDTLKKKATGTAKREDSGLRFWVKKFGDWDMLHIKNPQLSDYAQWRKTECTYGKNKKREVGGRALDLDVMALGHVYDFARTMGIIPKDHPEFAWGKLADAPAEDELLEPSQMDELCSAALLDPEALELFDPRVRHLRQAQELTGQAFHDFLRLLQYSGGREHETCLQEWANVTWSRKAKFKGDGGLGFRKGDKIPGTLFFPGARAKAGGGNPAKDRWVDFNDLLEEHLLAMYERRDPSSNWMFPGRNEGEPIQRFNRQLERVKRELRKKWEVKVPESEWKKSQWFDRFTFQWMRHYFISHAVMAGIDFKTIATWVSHRDGGVLIGRLYGHLDKTHSRAMAAKLNQHNENRSRAH